MSKWTKPPSDPRFPRQDDPEDPSKIDPEAKTPRQSGSFMIFHARASFALLQLAQCTAHSHTATLVLEGLRAKLKVFIEDCEAWPETSSKDVVERLAQTNALYQRLCGIEEEVKSYLSGGR